MIFAILPASRFPLHLMLCILLVTGVLRAQDQGPGYWLNAGFGTNSLGFISGSANVSLQPAWGVLSLRGTANSEDLFGDEIWDVGLLYGGAIRSNDLLLSGGVGVAIVGGSRSEGLFSGRVGIPSVIGFPLELQALWQIIPPFGIGLYGYADINSEESFAGFTICLHVGMFR